MMTLIVGVILELPLLKYVGSIMVDLSHPAARVSSGHFDWAYHQIQRELRRPK